jgi:DHA2 family multidrug resistance protein
MGSVLGPIIGPTLGGWIAETYNWRWLFHIVVPFAVVSLLGTLAVIHDREIAQRKALDWTGFLSLALALAAAQLMLDRGELADWFDSPEIIGWAAVALIALYAFVVHSLCTNRPLLDLRLFADRNFVVGLVLVFVFGMLNFTPMTLLPPLMQNVGSYPDSVVGLVIGSRGVGTLAAFSFMIVGSRIEPRLMIVAGFLLQAWAGWELAHLNTQPTVAAVLWPMVMQGFGVGLLWVPITMVTFTTLDPQLVPDGSAVYHMVRNFGSAVHISLTVTVSLRMARTAYGELAERVTPFNAPALPPEWSIDQPSGLASLARELHRQSMMIGYLDAFVFFVATSLVVLPLMAAIRLRKA